MTKRTGRVLFSWAIVVVMVGGAWAQATKPKPRATTAPARKPAATTRASSSSAVAVVGGLPIPRPTFEERVRMAEEAYRERVGNVPAEYRPLMRRQVLEGMIREKLLVLEARRRGMSLSAEQAEEEIKKDPFFRTGGSFDEAKFLAVKAGQPDRFRNAIADLQSTLPAIRLRERLLREYAPDSAALRQRIANELSTVRLRYLALRLKDFEGDVPQPREAEVLAYYHDHAGEFRIPERVRVSVLTVNQPPLDPSLMANEAARRAWDARMQHQADSVLAAIQRGAPLAGVAPLYGGLRSETVERDRFPKYWLATGRSREAVFSTPAGGLLPESVPAASGRILVRVDEREPAHVAPLREVAGKIRGNLLAAKQVAIDDQELREIYLGVRDSLRGNAYRIRYAVVDTATFPVPAPTQAELDRYYRGHQADYATLDRATASVVTLPFAQVRVDVERRLLRDRRLAAARAASDQLVAAWLQGKRDARLERLMSVTREVGPIPAGGVVDTGLAGIVLTDSLASLTKPRTGTIAFPRGLVVYHAYEKIPDFAPPFETSRSLLLPRREARKAAAEEAAARALFESSPERFRGGKVMLFSRLMVGPPSVFDVPLSREEVESWYRNHPEKYGAPELSRIRHILIATDGTGPAADAKARATADEVLKRLRAGEDFATLALRYSDDDATKKEGGDVGVFRPGMMLPEFERVAFSMEPGELRGPVRTEIGYDIMECLLHVPAEVVPLKYSYANVAVDAARSKGTQIARFRADSLLRSIHTVAQGRAIARRTGFPLYTNDHVIGTPMPSADIAAYVRRVEKLKPGQVYPEVQEYVGMGYAVTWVDSMLPPRSASWESARDQAIDLLRLDKSRRNLMAKRAELDSMIRVGWSFDSVAALWNGPEEHGPIGPGNPLPRLGGAQMLDSLAFGGEGKAPALKLDSLSDWIEFPGGIARLRLVERTPADPVTLATRFENDYRTETERNFRSVFDRMRQRFPVQILDPELKLVDLPPLESS